MKTWMRIVTAALVALAAAAQQYEIDTNTPEGQLLQQAGQEEDVAKRVALLEKFLAEYPKHQVAPDVLAQLPPAYAKLNQPDKALAAGEKLLEVKPADAASAHACLKIAEEQKNPDLIKKWSLATRDAAKKATEVPQPKEADEVVEWKTAVEFARQVGEYAEYSLSAAAMQATDPAKKAELIEALMQANPESKYLPQVLPQLFLAYRQAGNTEKAVAFAESAIAKNQADEDMLLVAADYYMNTKKDPAKVLDLSGKLVAMMETKPAPQGVSPADWETKKKNMLGLGHWMTGITYATQNKLAETDKSLRTALPFIEGNDQLRAAALFHLGVANFRMGEKTTDQKRLMDAVNFTKQCAAIKSPFQGQAQKNLAAIQRQYRMQ